MKTIKEIKFSSLQIHKKKCLYISNNKAVVRNKELYCLADIINDKSFSNVYVDECIKDAADTGDLANVYIDIGLVLYNVRYYIDRFSDLDKISEGWQCLTSVTYEYLKDKIYSTMEYGGFVNVAEIKLFELAGEPDTEVQKLVQYRLDYIKKREQAETEKRKQERQAEKEFVIQKNKEVDDKVIQAEKDFLDGKEITNEDIDIYKSKYEYSTTSLVLVMLKRNNISVPLKTQGWINKVLARVYIKDGKPNYAYFKGSANSTVFSGILDELKDSLEYKYSESKDEIEKLFFKKEVM